MTSAANAVTRVYGPWQTVPNSRVVVGDAKVMQDSDTGIWYLVNEAELRVPYQADLDLSARQDQVRYQANNEAKPTIWDVAQRFNNNAGSISGYGLMFKQPLVNNPRDGAL